jgi:acetoin:2,6-dichlorophenolindophenol oxidoreductase subunit beta
MPRPRYLQALGQALADEMERDQRVCVFGEDVGASLRGVTTGLRERFGSARVVDTPLSEQAFTGVATGAALRGFRVVR